MKNFTKINIPKFQSYTLYFLFSCLMIFSISENVNAQQYDYGDLLGKSIFFIEANACGYKPPTSTVSWRGDCHLEDGNGDYIGGFHDAGDHVKFNYPMAMPIYTWALAYLDYKKQFQDTNTEERILGVLRHAGEYMIRCHPSPNEYVIQVGQGTVDHRYWQAPEDNTYFRDVYKINKNKPGSDLAGPTAGAMAAVSMVFKNIDPNFSNNLLSHARDLFRFADQYRGPFSKHVPSGELNFYRSQNGSINQIDDLMIGAVWLYRATGEQFYKNKADGFFEQIKFLAQGYAPSFGDHQYQAHMIMAQITGDAKYINASIRSHINNSLNQHYTRGGLWLWRSSHNEFNSYQAVGNAYLAYALAEFVGPNDNKYQDYKNYAIGQMEYLSGSNPRNSSYVGGFGPNFPRRIHHRAANGDTHLKSGAPDDIHVLYGALVSGPDSNDNYSNDRSNHRQTEPTLAPNGFLTILAAQLTKEYGLSDPDPDPTPIGDVFYIKSKALNTYMRPQNNNLDSPIVLVEKDNSDWFKWERVARSDGYYHLKNIKTGMYFRPSRNDDGVDPDVNNDGIGALMLQKPTNWKGAWTQWKEVISDDGSSYHLQNKELQKFLRPVTVNSISQLEIVPNTFRGNYTRWIFEAAEGGNSSGSCEVTVRAAGSTGEEVIQLLIDDEFAFEWAITSTSLANYKATVPNGGNVKIRFMNDGNTSSGADKNLRVDKLTFGGVTIEAENVTRQGCGNNEWLWCGGYFDFGNLSCQNRSSISDNKDNLSEVFKTYPNPMTSDILTVIGPDLFRITVYDIQGGVVMDSDQISGKQTIDTQGLSNGLYIVKMYDYNSKSTKTNKIIVNKQ